MWWWWGGGEMRPIFLVFLRVSCLPMPFSLHFVSNPHFYSIFTWDQAKWRLEDSKACLFLAFVIQLLDFKRYGRIFFLILLKFSFVVEVLTSIYCVFEFEKLWKLKIHLFMALNFGSAARCENSSYLAIFMVKLVFYMLERLGLSNPSLQYLNLSVWT